MCFTTQTPNYFSVAMTSIIAQVKRNYVLFFSVSFTMCIAILVQQYLIGGRKGGSSWKIRSSDRWSEISWWMYRWCTWHKWLCTLTNMIKEASCRSGTVYGFICTYEINTGSETNQKYNIKAMISHSHLHLPITCSFIWIS